MNTTNTGEITQCEHSRCSMCSLKVSLMSPFHAQPCPTSRSQNVTSRSSPTRPTNSRHTSTPPCRHHYLYSEMCGWTSSAWERVGDYRPQWRLRQGSLCWSGRGALSVYRDFPTLGKNHWLVSLDQLNISYSELEICILSTLFITKNFVLKWYNLFLEKLCTHFAAQNGTEFKGRVFL